MSNANSLIYSVTVDGLPQPIYRDWMSAIVAWHQAKDDAVWSATVHARKNGDNEGVLLAHWTKDKGEVTLVELSLWGNPPFTTRNSLFRTRKA